MKTALLVGNGINQVSDNGASWTALLNALAGAPKSLHDQEIRKAKPFTLWFEELASTNRVRNLKMRVAEALVANIAPNEFHEELMNLGVENILTTNYDYGLEDSTSRNWESNSAARETYYSLFRRKSSGANHIWHIHGEVANVSSMMLGHQQYSGYLNKIRNFLTNGVPTESNVRNGRPYVSKYSGKNSRKKGDTDNWVDIFIASDLHIVGFGLDYTENHLWSLLMEKRRLRKKNQRYVGHTFFHRCSDTYQDTSDEARASILEAIDVRIMDHTAGTFADGYSKCINHIRNSI